MGLGHLLRAASKCDVPGSRTGFLLSYKQRRPRKGEAYLRKVSCGAKSASSSRLKTRHFTESGLAPRHKSVSICEARKDSGGDESPRSMRWRCPISSTLERVGDAKSDLHSARPPRTYRTAVTVRVVNRLSSWPISPPTAVDYVAASWAGEYDPCLPHRLGAVHHLVRRARCDCSACRRGDGGPVRDRPRQGRRALHDRCPPGSCQCRPPSRGTRQPDQGGGGPPGAPWSAGGPSGPRRARCAPSRCRRCAQWSGDSELIRRGVETGRLSLSASRAVRPGLILSGRMASGTRPCRPEGRCCPRNGSGPPVVARQFARVVVSCRPGIVVAG